MNATLLSLVFRRWWCSVVLFVSYMALSSADLVTLLTLLETPNASFSTLCSEIKSKFLEGDLFSVACALVALLDDNSVLLHPRARLTALYLLLDMYGSSPLTANPFLSTLLEALDKASLAEERAREAEFIRELLKGYTLLSSVTPESFLAGTARWSRASGPTAAPPPSFEELQSHVAASALATTSTADLAVEDQGGSQERQPSGRRATPTVKHVLHDPDLFSMLDVRTTEMELLGGPITSLSGFQPPYARVPPPLWRSLSFDEVLWLGVDVAHELKWDPTFCAEWEGGSLTILRHLMDKAHEHTLQGREVEQIRAILNGNSKLVFSCGLSPQRFPVLVENNPLVASAVLLILLSCSDVTEYMNVLVNTTMSLRSMEVMMKVSSVVALPRTYLHEYVFNCFSSCEAIKDTYTQNRLVRLVCVFLQTLIRNKTINIEDIYAQVEAFCFPFSRIREAAGLYRLLKSIDPTTVIRSGGPAGGGGGGGGGDEELS